MYADDLVLISPSSVGLSQLLHECEKFGTRHDLKSNTKKSAVMIYRSMTLRGCTIPNFKLNGIILHVVASYISTLLLLLLLYSMECHLIWLAMTK